MTDRFDVRSGFDVKSLFDVSGKVALVSGSSRGLGLALARGLAEAGAVVVLNGRDPQRLAAARDELASGAEMHARAFDVTDSAAVDAAVAGIERDVGEIEILVNNAGMQLRAPITDYRDDDWQQLLATNLTSAFLLSRAVAANMTGRQHGKIVNICSLQSEVARPGIAAYSATKGALKMLTRGLCADLAPHGIQVNGIGPGYFDTELTAPLVADAEFSAWVRRRTPAGRWGRPADLVGALLFLSSAASEFVNGQILYVDGGMLAVL